MLNSISSLILKLGKHKPWNSVILLNFISVRIFEYLSGEERLLQETKCCYEIEESGGDFGT